MRSFRDFSLLSPLVFVFSPVFLISIETIGALFSARRSFSVLRFLSFFALPLPLFLRSRTTFPRSKVERSPRSDDDESDDEWYRPRLVNRQYAKGKRERERDKKLIYNLKRQRSVLVTSERARASEQWRSRSDERRCSNYRVGTDCRATRTVFPESLKKSAIIALIGAQSFKRQARRDDELYISIAPLLSDSTSSLHTANPIVILLNLAPIEIVLLAHV